MALISNIGAGIFTTLSFEESTSNLVTAFDAIVAATTAADKQTAYAVSSTGLKDEFGTGTEVKNVREFPAFGAPANIVNVPVYGQSVSSQISGQSDAPTLEFTLNYVPGEAGTIALEGAVADGKTYFFKINLKNSEASTSDNAAFFVQGSLASFTVSPNLTDSNQATLTLTTTSDYIGPLAD